MKAKIAQKFKFNTTKFKQNKFLKCLNKFETKVK